MRSCRFPILLLLFISPGGLRAQIASIQRIIYGSPLIDSLPRNQFPRGGTYTATVQGAGLKNVTGFVASNPNVTGTVNSATDSTVTIQISSTSVAENDTTNAPIASVLFTLLQTAPFGEAPLPSISSGAVTLDIIVGEGPQVTSWKLAAPQVKWIAGGVKATITYLADVTSSGNVQSFYVECFICAGTSIQSWTNTGDQFTSHWTVVLDVTAPTDFGTTNFPYAYGAVDGAGQGGLLGNDPLSPSKPLNIPIVQAQLVDPVPDLLDGPAVTTDSSLLANQALGRVVKGVSADGVSTLVVRLAGAPPNETFSFTLGADGGLGSVGSSSFVSTLSVQADSSGNALFLYRAPLDFARPSGSDDTATSRTVDLNFQSPDNNPAVVGDASIMIMRPPVVLVHGLWDSSAAWAGFAPLTTDSRFFVRSVSYCGLLSGVTTSSPVFSSSVLARARENSLGFAYNAPNVLAQIRQFIAEFKDSNEVAAVQADVVAHSMGGDISRSLRRLPNYLTSENFSLGALHKLITIGTPHLGTPLATQLLQAQNSCVRDLLATKGNIAFATVALSATTYSGGAGDLQGDGSGGGLSSALQSLRLSPLQGVPTSTIAGTMTANNLSGLGCVVCRAEYIRHHCASDPLALALTASGWPALFGQSSDAIVPRFSQLNGTTGLEFTGLVHSVGAENLGFAGPSELDQSSGIPGKVIDLLNEATAGIDFRIL